MSEYTAALPEVHYIENQLYHAIAADNMVAIRKWESLLYEIEQSIIAGNRKKSRFSFFVSGSVQPKPSKSEFQATRCSGRHCLYSAL